jgi:hypothetical protein
MALSENQIQKLAEGNNPLGLDYKIGDIVYSNGSYMKFRRNGECRILNFINKVFVDLFYAFRSFDTIINAKFEKSRLYTRLEIIEKIHFFKVIDELRYTFFNSIIADDLVNLLQPPSKEDSVVREWYHQLLPNLEKMLSIIHPTQYFSKDFTSFPKEQPTKLSTTAVPFKNTKNTAKKVGGSISKRQSINKTMKSARKSLKQSMRDPNKPNSRTRKHTVTTIRHRNIDILQCHDLSDLLRTISAKAAAFIESLLTTKYESRVPQPNELILFLRMEYLENVVQCMQEIEFMWLEGILLIQQNNGDAYDYIPTKPEYILMRLLSMYYDKTDSHNDFNDDFLAINREHYGVFETQKNRASLAATTQLNDIGQMFLESEIPAEIINILVLTLIDNTMQPFQNPENKRGYYYEIITNSSFPSNTFDNNNTWEDLPRYLYSYFTYVTTGNLPDFSLLRG